MAVAIRPAAATDAETIRRLVRTAGINPLSLRWPRFLVAEDAGRIVGIGQIKPHGDGSRELASIATVPDRQGEGIATAIIRALLNAETGALYLTCRSSLAPFYERFGFRRVLSPEEAPAYFRRIMRLWNALLAVVRIFGYQERGLVMVRVGA